MSSNAPMWGLLGRTSSRFGVQIVELRTVSVRVTIRGLVAQVSASLVYHNTGSEPLEVEYVFPVDESAAVYKFEARLDGRTITAQCMEKKKAQKVYEEAVSAGYTALLAQEDELSSDVLHMALGNLPPGLKAELKLCLVMELKVQTDGGVSFVMPTVLNPRYCPSDVQEVHKANVTPDAGARLLTVHKTYTINIEGEVRGSHDITRIISHTDPLNVTISEDAKSAQITQDGGFKCDHDWSLLLYYANPYKTHVIRETGDRSATGLMKDDLIMINLFPEVPANSYSNRNEVIFVIDRSGSMQGENIQSARATLLLFLKSLPAGCLFNIVSFGSTFTLLFPQGSREYNETTLAEACALQENMNANMGGTEILQPFKSIYSQPPKTGYSRQVLLISDGSVWNVAQVTQLVGRHAHETRVFAVGIGHGASTALIHGVARAGRGRSEMVIQQDKLQHKVMGLVSSMVQESVHNVRIACEVEPTSRVTLIPKVPPVIFGGQHLILYARLPSTTTVKTVSVAGNIGDTDISEGVTGNVIVAVHDSEMSLHRLAARAQINQWQLDEEEDIGEDLITLSMASGVVCKLTALVGVDQDGKQQNVKSHKENLFFHQQGGFSFGSAQPYSPRHTPMIQQGFSFGSAQSYSPRRTPMIQQGSMSFGSAQPQAGSMSFGNAQPQAGSMSFGSAQPQVGSMSFGSAQPQAGSMSFGSAQPQAGSMSFGSAQPQAGSMSFGSAQPQAGSMSFGSAQPQAGFSFGSAQPQAGSMSFDSAQPQAGSMSFRSAQPQAGSMSFGSAQPQAQQSLALNLYCSPEASPRTVQEETSCVGSLLEIVKLQNFDGSWTLKDVARLCALSPSQLTDSNPSKNESAWATAVALALLEGKYKEERDQWSLLANKARIFISGCGEDADSLVKSAQSLLSAQH